MRADPRPTFLFVHGGSSNARAWGPLQNELALRGLRSYAVDLPGHGDAATGPAAYHRQPRDPAALASEPSPMHGVTLADNVRHVVGVLRRLTAHGPVVLAGNSLGGLTLTAVVNAVPDLVHRVVYLSALCLADPALLTGARDVPDDNLLDAAAARIAVPYDAPGRDPGVVRLDWRRAHHDPEVFALLKAAIMADATDHRFRLFLDTLDADENHGVLEPAALVDPGAWRRVPHTYVRFSADRALTPAVQDHMIRTADALTPDHPFEVHTLPVPHVGYVHRPEPFADLLARLG
ncbi:alpha/beta hydrolase [Streptomyces filamentosus]|uniref:Alpha/beta hydrolase n=1 Tax=Streptomyces filamentosus TaxID=67294 RepID=A0A919BCY0_STRFL|nr:alpha/beta fold hydrolase [Streptomyces filamentosus]GHF79789.1 alpha/beta hydrolase [Streptomyces filamentosus]